MDKGIPSDLITIDYTKEFYKIDIDLLINKLSNYYHISPSFCQLIHSLHSERIQLVSYKYSQSNLLPISGGLSQGSILSPLLFIAFINDLFEEKFSNNIVAFAEDIKLFGAKLDEMQNDLNKILKWSTSNKMYINPSKCETLHFGTTNPKLQHHLSGSPIPPVKILQDFRLFVGQHLTFHYHTELYPKSVTKK